MLWYLPEHLLNNPLAKEGADLKTTIRGLAADSEV